MKDTRFTLDQRLSKVSSIVDGGNKYCEDKLISGAFKNGRINT
jgi:hypothetical protein